MDVLASVALVAIVPLAFLTAWARYRALKDNPDAFKKEHKR